MLNWVWLVMLLVAMATAGVTGNIRGAVDASIKGAETAVTLAFGLVGVMSLWLGIMRLAERSGLVTSLARGLRPILVRLFPEVPPEHPAMGSVVMNIAANLLGLTNAATPLGLRAMRDLERLNPRPGTATNAMCTFLAINTGSVQLVPASAIALLASAGSVNPTAVVGSALVATTFSSVAGVAAVKWLERTRWFAMPATQATTPPGEAAAGVVQPAGEAGAVREGDGVGGEEDVGRHSALRPLTVLGWVLLVAVLVAFGVLVLAQAFPGWFGRAFDPGSSPAADWVRVLNALSLLAIPFLLTVFPLYAALRGVPVYEEFLEGAKEGFQVAIRIIPFLVAMLVAIGFLRGAGAIEGFTEALRGPLSAVGFPPELLPLSLVRPLSGSASLATVADLVQTHGADSLIARTAATLFGSTETTFYVIAVYFGAVGIRRTRHALWAGLIADATGVVASVVVCRAMFG